PGLSRAARDRRAHRRVEAGRDGHAHRRDVRGAAPVRGLVEVGDVSVYSFAHADRLLFTSESVTEGHPDKLCDQVSDAILDAIMEQDPSGRVACETAATTGLVIVLGEITTNCYVDMPKIIRNTVREIGYTNAAFGFDYETTGVMVSIKEQSPDIRRGVDQSLEVRSGEMSDAELEKTGAGDQGMMIGFACDE